MATPPLTRGSSANSFPVLLGRAEAGIRQQAPHTLDPGGPPPPAPALRAMSSAAAAAIRGHRSTGTPWWSPSSARMTTRRSSRLKRSSRPFRASVRKTSSSRKGPFRPLGHPLFHGADRPQKRTLPVRSPPQTNPRRVPTRTARGTDQKAIPPPRVGPTPPHPPNATAASPRPQGPLPSKRSRNRRRTPPRCM